MSANSYEPVSTSSPTPMASSPTPMSTAPLRGLRINVESPSVGLQSLKSPTSIRRSPEEMFNAMRSPPPPRGLAFMATPPPMALRAGPLLSALKVLRSQPGAAALAPRNMPVANGVSGTSASAPSLALSPPAYPSSARSAVPAMASSPMSPPDHTDLENDAMSPALDRPSSPVLSQVDVSGNASTDAANTRSTA